MHHIIKYIWKNGFELSILLWLNVKKNKCNVWQTRSLASIDNFKYIHTNDLLCFPYLLVFNVYFKFD